MYCENCGKKVPSDSKFCPDCGGNVSEASSSEKEKKPQGSRARKIATWAGYCLVFLLIAGGVAYYFIGVSKIAVYTHPTLGFTLAYSKTLNVETPAITGYQCLTEPCLILLKNPSYNNDSVNWIFIIPISFMGGDRAKLQAESDKDVSDGAATAITVNDIKMNKYVNDPNKPVETILSLYKMLSLDPSKEESVYTFLTNESGIMVGFRTPPTGAPGDYKDYLNIQSWKNSAAVK